MQEKFKMSKHLVLETETLFDMYNKLKQGNTEEVAKEIAIILAKNKKQAKGQLSAKVNKDNTMEL